MMDGQWIDERIEANRERLTAWMAEKRAEVPFPSTGAWTFETPVGRSLRWTRTTSRQDSTTCPMKTAHGWRSCFASTLNGRPPA